MAKTSTADYSTSDSGSDDDSDAFRRPSTDPTSNEFSSYHNNPRKRRRTGRDAKESAALGIFGSESEDDTQLGGRKWKRKPLRKQGVSFVSSRVDKSEQEKEEEVNEEKYTEQKDGKEDGNESRRPEKMKGDDDNDGNEPRGIGLSFSSSTQSLRFTKATWTKATVPTWVTAADVGSSNPLERGFMPSSAADPILRVHDKNTDKPLISAKPSAFSSRATGGRGRGGFNTKSFGARMMAKMGYVAGEGLGKEGQGRNIIIEANLRPQGAGLGAVREKSEKERQEEKRQARLRGEAVTDEDEEEQKIKAAARKKNAFHSGTSTPRQPKTKYMTMEEVRRSAPGLNIPDSFTPILDLTGPDRKLLTLSSGLMTPTTSSSEMATAVAAEETAEHRASRNLTRRAQADFLAILEEWESLQNRKAYADLQAQQLRQELAELQDSLQSHTVVADLFGRLSVGSYGVEAQEPWEKRWNRTIGHLEAATDAIPESSWDEMQDDLANISVAAVLPLFREAVAVWEPLRDPGLHLVQGMHAVQKWAASLPQKLHRRRAPASSYETMFYKIWLPHVSRAVRQWDAHDPDSLLALYEAWKLLLPDFVRTQLLEQDIVRRLDEAIQRWEPKRRRRHHEQGKSQSLPHLWLFPWLPYLPPRQLDPASADSLVADVKRKLRQLIHVWEFYRGEMPGLRQWRNMLCPCPDNDQWRPLVLSHVLPSMATYLRAQFRVDPQDQAPYLEVLTGEFQWLGPGLVSADMLGQVVVAEIFPMWHNALYRMLTTLGLATLDQLTQWLQWWADEAFPESIRRLPAVTAEFERGLAMVNEALDLGGDPVRVQTELVPPASRHSGDTVGARDAPPQQHSRYRHHHHRAAVPAVPTHAEEGMSIRHYVQDWCENNDLQFMPERKRVHTEGPLYRITARGDGKGGVLVYFKGLRLYVENKKGPFEVRVDREEDWARLLEMAQ